MLVNEAMPVFEGSNLFLQVFITVSGLFFTGLLLYITVEPSIVKRRQRTSIKIHPEMQKLIIDIPKYEKIAIALDFSENDKKLISYALGQGHSDTKYVLVHVVESVSANLWGSQSYDYETRKDQAQLDAYVVQLRDKGINASGMLGFKHRAKEIVRLVKKSNADMLVTGAHGHRGIKDLLYGQTVNTVRHELKIPVLMVSLKSS
jgi:manganese transport protein